MKSLEEFKESLLSYLYTEKKITEEQREREKQMSDEEKMENNLLLKDVTILESEEDTYVLNAPDNYSKIRTGDKILVRKEGEAKSHQAVVLDVYFDSITIECNTKLEKDSVYSIETDAPNLIQSLIACLEDIGAGKPGASFLRLLSGEETAETDDFLQLVPEEILGYQYMFGKLEQEQQDAVRTMLQYPPIHVLQGPPGTGKTQVLALTAIATAKMNREVVIIANTHHAVNNALLKIRSIDKSACIFKVGDRLKAEELDDSITKFAKFSEYNEYSYNNRRKKRSGHIIGMTIWGAITYLGLHQHSHFRPYQALVDEASLMGLTYASILGKCATSICLFGDSWQMQPIFLPELESHELSTSVLDYCVNEVRGVSVSVLHTTFRMNAEVTDLVSKSFYEPYGIKLVSADAAKDRKLQIPQDEQEDERIKEILTSKNSVFSLNVSTIDNCTESNMEEALFAAHLASAAMNEGMPSEAIAVITPFRKQVNKIRAAFKHLGWTPEECPLIDTVERLQGQDVEMIIISFAVTDSCYYEQIKGFLLNPNRLNVMISRAKTKVVILKSETIAFT